ncbi:MAG: ATP-binding protein, partial [Chloroflexi bacterium]|nr:ATP-binding protein [Chloroflexota bacterium]
EIAGEVAQQLAIALRQARYRDDLAEREARIRAVLEGSPDAVLTVASDGTIAYANPAATRAFTIDGRLVGRPVHDLLATDARATLELRVAGALADPEAAGVARLPAVDAIAADGTTFPAAVEIAPIRGAADAGVVVTVHDLSERVALETRLAQSQRVETLGRFAGILAHDVRSYITAIDWATASLSAGLAQDDPRQADIRLIATAVAEAREFLWSVLEFARPGAQGGSADLGGHLSRMGGILTRLLGPEVRLEVDVPHDLPAVRLAPSAVTQILVNLATNARDAMPDGGSFSIVARAREIAPASADTAAPTAGSGGMRGGSALPPGHYVRLEVADTGIGMDREAVAGAFEAFYTTKSDAIAEVGTGLGLASVHLLVVRAGGEISVESEPDRGTRFVMDLPVAD